jgi:hypothetical protein
MACKPHVKRSRRQRRLPFQYTFSLHVAFSIDHIMVAESDREIIIIDQIRQQRLEELFVPSVIVVQYRKVLPRTSFEAAIWFVPIEAYGCVGNGGPSYEKIRQSLVLGRASIAGDY